MENNFSWDTNKFYLKNHIIEAFCKDCRHCSQDVGGAYSCPKFIYANGVCIAFEWKSDKAFEQYKQDVLEAQAVTIYLNRGKTLEEIYTFSKEKLLSVLTKAHYTVFEERVKQDAEMTKIVTELIKKGNRNSAQVKGLQQPKINCLTQPRHSTETELTSLPFMESEGTTQPEQKEKIKKQVITEKIVSKTGAQATKKEVTINQPRNLLTRAKGTLTKQLIHYFYTKDQQGNLKTYTKKTDSKGYKSDVVQLRKMIVNKNMVLLSEEIK